MNPSAIFTMARRLYNQASRGVGLVVLGVALYALAVSFMNSSYLHPTLLIVLPITFYLIACKYRRKWLYAIAPSSNYHLSLVSERYDSDSRIATLRYVREGIRTFVVVWALSIVALVALGLFFFTLENVLLAATVFGVVVALFGGFVKLVKRAKYIVRYDYIPATPEFRDLMKEVHGVGYLGVLCSDNPDEDLKEITVKVEKIANDPEHEDRVHARRWLDREGSNGAYNNFGVSELLEYCTQDELVDKLVAESIRITDQGAQAQ